MLGVCTQTLTNTVGLIFLMMLPCLPPACSLLIIQYSFLPGSLQPPIRLLLGVSHNC